MDVRCCPAVRCSCHICPLYSPHISPLGVASVSSYTSVGAEVCVCMTGPEFGTCCALTPVGHGGGLLLLLLPFDRYCLFVDVSSWWFGAHGQMIWRVHWPASLEVVFQGGSGLVVVGVSGGCWAVIRSLGHKASGPGPWLVSGGWSAAHCSQGAHCSFGALALRPWGICLPSASLGIQLLLWRAASSVLLVGCGRPGSPGPSSVWFWLPGAVLRRLILFIKYFHDKCTHTLFVFVVISLSVGLSWLCFVTNAATDDLSCFICTWSFIVMFIPYFSLFSYSFSFLFSFLTPDSSAFLHSTYIK